MGDPKKDEWLRTALGVAIDATKSLAGTVGQFVPGNAQPAAKGGAPHVTVIDTPIVVHGKDPPPVVEINKPIVVKVDDKARQQLRDLDQSVIDVSERASRIVTTLHQDMFDRVGTWFRKDAVAVIDSMSDGPGDLSTGLASSFANGISGVVALAFPEVGVAMVTLAGVGQAVIVDAAKEDAAKLKAQAKQMMLDLATEAETLIYKGRDEALKKIPSLVDKLSWDAQASALFVEHSNETVETLANRIAAGWGTLADPQVLDKLEATLHRTLQLRIKVAAKNKKAMEIRAKVAKAHFGMTEEEGRREMEEWETHYDIENGTMPEYQPIDTTRPD